MQLNLNTLSILEYELELFDERRPIQQITISRLAILSRNKWSIYMGNTWVLGKKEKFFICNGILPGKDEFEFAKDTHFDSFEDALKFWLENKEYILQKLNR